MGTSASLDDTSAISYGYVTCRSLVEQGNLDFNGRNALKKLLAANSQLNTDYLSKDTFGQLWDYKTACGARAFFERWNDSLEWKRFKPYMKFALEVTRRWDAITSYCPRDKKVSLGLV